MPVAEKEEVVFDRKVAHSEGMFSAFVYLPVESLENVEWLREVQSAIVPLLAGCPYKLVDHFHISLTR